MQSPVSAKRRFQLVLIKPSHYDDDGYVIRWWRAMIPSNTLAAVYGIAADCAERQVLGPDVAIDIEVMDATHFRATAKVGIGFISARFVVNMEMAELSPPDRAVIKAHGQAPGSAVDATASMTLSDVDGGSTRMDWNADVAIAGSLASLGGRLIEGTANKMIGQTFGCMKEKLEA